MKYFLSFSFCFFIGMGLFAQQKKSTLPAQKKSNIKQVPGKSKIKIISSTAVSNTAIEKTAQITGQWKGSFVDKSTEFIGWGGDKCDYVLELECTGSVVTGFSYTYFTDGGIRYYTICKLKGVYNKSQKFVEVKEIERTKTNVPNTVRNCFQIHRLTYFKEGDTETLEGNWIPVPNQEGDCGHGSTLLTRRTLKNSFPNFNNGNVAKAQQKILQPKKTPEIKPKQTPITSTTTKITPKKKEKIVENKNIITKKETEIVNAPTIIKTEPEKIETPKLVFVKRDNNLLKTIEVENETVKVELYDNGEIDGDSISLFYNGKLLLSNKKLTTKPIALDLKVENNKTNELLMYADNLGTIPPNTALMVVTDGAKRYEVRITSDLKKSGVIQFVHKAPN